MALNASNVTYAKTGEVFAMPLNETIFEWDTAIPVTAKSLGYINADAITISDTNTRTPERAWQNSDVVAEFVTDGETTASFNLLEVKNRDVIEAAYGVTISENGSYKVDPNKAPVLQTIIIRWTDGVTTETIWYPAATLVVSGEYTLSGTTSIFLPVTVSGRKRNIGGVSYGPKEVSNEALATP